MKGKQQMMKVGVPVNRGHVFVEVPMDTIPIAVLRDALRERKARLEWDAENLLKKVEDLNQILGQI